jgi:hypothetical protein
MNMPKYLRHMYPAAEGYTPAERYGWAGGPSGCGWCGTRRRLLADRDGVEVALPGKFLQEVAKLAFLRR